MNHSDSIDEIKKRHHELYEIALKDIPDLLRKASESPTEGARVNVEELLRENKKFEHYLDNLDSLISDIRSAAAQTESFDVYKWFRDAATKWQTVYSGTLNIPKIIQLSLPTKELVLPKLVLPSLPVGRALSEEEIKDRCKSLSAHTLRCRRKEFGIWPTEEEKAKDYYLAEVSFVVDVLEGHVNFPSRIGKLSYWRLENMWLKEAKEYMAYMYTLLRDDLMAIHPDRDRQDFEKICENIRELLVSQQKGLISEFDEPQSYIEEHYLTDGKLDLSKPEVIEQVDKKAHRFAEKILESSGKPDDFKNHVDAETYMRMFYENIIPAVLETNQENAKDKVLTVLKSLQFSKSATNRYHVVNCFEVALAMYFINAQVIKELWGEFVDQPPPDSCVESVVNIKSWPETFKTPKECEGVFFHFDQRIVFKGVMSNAQKDLLLALVQSKQQKDSIKKVFMKSRTVHRETTL